MGTRRSHEELIAEFHRLCDAFDCNDECAYLGYSDPERIGGNRMGPYPREKALSWLAAKTATPSQIVAGARKALSDLSIGLLDVLRNDPMRFRTILERYRTRTARDYFEDAGHPKKMLKVLLRRDRLFDEAEYRLLDAFLNDMSSSMSDAERQTGEMLVAAYRTRTE
jgi:hypothetical protein